jgi:hypothetical protein
MGRHQYVDRIDLHQPQPPDDAADLPHIRLAWPGPVESQRGQRDATGFVERDHPAL